MPSYVARNCHPSWQRLAMLGDTQSRVWSWAYLGKVCSLIDCQDDNQYLTQALRFLVRSTLLYRRCFFPLASTSTMIQTLGIHSLCCIVGGLAVLPRLSTYSLLDRWTLLPWRFLLHVAVMHILGIGETDPPSAYAIAQSELFPTAYKTGQCPPLGQTSHSITVKQGLDYSKTRLSSEGSEQVVGSTYLIRTSFLQLLRMSWIYFRPCQTLRAFCYYGNFFKEANGAALPATSIPSSLGRNTPAAGHRHRHWLEQVKSSAVSARLWPKQTQR